MENLTRSFKVNQLTFNNYSKQAKLAGVLFQDNFSYESELIISVQQLNVVLNQMQQLNPGVDVNELLIADELPNDEVYYSMNMGDLAGQLSFDMLFEDLQYRLIRA